MPESQVSDSMIARIQKLMRLSDSPVPGEAAAAAAKVQELLFAYNLDMSTVIAQDVEGKEIEVETNRIYFPAGNYSRSWRVQIAAIIGRGHYCRTIRLGGFKQDMGYAFVGRKHNVQASIQVAQWVIDELVKMCDESARKHRVRKTNWTFRQSFYLGAIQELNARITDLLYSQETGEQKSTALVLAKDAAVEKKSP